MSSIKLDTAIAKEIFGRKIIGSTICANIPEDGWGVYPGPKTKKRLAQWHCQAEIRPVFIREKCQCLRLRTRSKDRKIWMETWERDKEAGRIFKGHFAQCLDLVPPYSGEFNYAMEVVKKLDPPSFGLFHHGEFWETIFIGPCEPCCSRSRKADKGDLDAAAYAIAKAALQYHRNSRKSLKR